MRFAEAVYAGGEDEIRVARLRVKDVVGDEGMVSAAAVIGNFTRMVRIADSTGIPLDAPVEIVSSDFRSDIGLDDFGSAGNTPIGGPVRRVVTPILRPLLKRALPFVAKRLMPRKDDSAKS